MAKNTPKTSTEITVPFGRAPEIRQLEAALDRAVGGSRELLFVRGESGIGKTALVDSLKPSFLSKGLFGSGKFEPGRRQEPRFALMGAFGGMIRSVLLLPERELAQRRAAVQNALEGLGGVLLASLPELIHVIGPQSEPPVLGPVEGHHRFNFLFGRLLETLGGTDPLILFLDDLQWADESSLDLLSRWISLPAGNGFFIMAAFRTPAEAELSRFLMELEDKGHSPTYLDLRPLDAGAVNAWVAAVFEDAGDANLALEKSILENTRGHPFHIHQYLEALRRHRYADFRPSEERWILRFRDAVLPVDVAPSRHLLSLTLASLSARARECLEIAACAGFSFPPGLVASAMGSTASELTGLLDEGLRLGLVTVPETGATAEAIHSSYAFTHDQVAEALLGGLGPEQAQSIHLRLGESLREGSPDPEETVFAVCGHLNYAQALIRDGARRRSAAELNLLAGRKAKASAAFGEAFKYFKAGLEFLPVEAWDDCYPLALALNLEASETSFMSGDHGGMEAFVQEIEKRARTFLDYAPAGEILIQSLASRHRLKESVDCGLSMLARLGLAFPVHPGKADALLAILSAEWTLLGKSFRSLENQALARDPEKLAMARIMSHIHASVYISRPGLHPLILIAQLKLSLRHGVNRVTPFVYGVYGFIQCGVLRRYDRGRRFGQLALKLHQRHKVEESTAKVLFVLNHFIGPWSEPLEDTLSGLEQGLTGALKSGDIEFAGHLANVYGMHLYHSGADLEKTRSTLLEHKTLITGLSQGRSLLLQNLYLQSVESLLQARPADPRASASESILKELEAGGDEHGIALWHLNRLILAVVSRDGDAALAAAAEVEKRLESFTGLFFTGWYHFHHALALSGLGNPKGPLRRRFDAHFRKIESFAKQCPGNYRHKYHLLAAEAHRMDGRASSAREEYILSVEAARKAKATGEEALAWERMFLFHHKRGERGFAGLYLGEQIACLRRWGAEARLEQVFAELRSEYPRVFRDPDAFAGGSRDFRKILSISQSIAVEMDLDRLMVTLMDAIVDLTGAGRACLVATAADGFRILAEKGKSRESVQTIGSREELPGSILVYVSRTGKTVNLGDAERDEQFGRDPYFKTHECKSVLCFPLKSQGKTEALLYLENPHAVGAFLRNDPWTEWVGGQAAISLRNAQYHRQRMTALKARINPHFLFNALTTISETILDEPKDAVRGVAKLSKLYRYLLQSSDQDLVPLERELEFVDLYVSIEKLRYGNRLNYRREVEAGLGGMLIPPLSVQPLVENAIKHGVAPKPGGGTVTLDIRTQGGFCRISIGDDGVGWGGGKPGTGEGHRNILERLCLVFGDRARLDFSDSTGTPYAAEKTVEAVLWIPLEEKD